MDQGRRKMFMRKLKRCIAMVLTGTMLTANLPSDAFRSNAEENDVKGILNAADESIEVGNETETVEQTADRAGEEIEADEQTADRAEEDKADEQTEGRPEEENEADEQTEDRAEEFEQTEYKHPSFVEGFPGAPLSGMNFDSKELLIAAEDVSVFTWDTEVISGYDGVYLTRYATAEEAKNAYTYYYGKVDFISPNITFTVSDEEEQTDVDQFGSNRDDDLADPDQSGSNRDEDLPDADLSGLNQGDDALAVLNGMDTDSAVPDGTIAMIDTGVNSEDVYEKVSLIGGSASDDNGHGSRIYSYIMEEYPQAKVLSIKALGADGKGRASDIYAAIRYAVERKVSVINLSLSAYSTADNAVVRSAIEEAVASGITVVGAAGNNGTNARYYIPGGISDALIVGACDESGVRRSSSNYGDTVDFNVVAGSTSEASARMSAFVSAGMTQNAKVFDTVVKTEEEEDILYFRDTPKFSVADQTITVTIDGETVTIPNVPDSISVTLDAAGKKDAVSYGPNAYPDGTKFTFPGQQVSGNRGYCISPSTQPATVGSVGTDYELGNYFGEGTYTYRVSDTVTRQRDGYITMTLNGSVTGFAFLPGNAWCCQSSKNRTKGLSGTGNLFRVSDTGHYKAFAENGKKYIYIPYYNQGFTAGVSEDSDEQRIGYSAYLKYEVPGDFYLSVEKRSASDTVKPEMSGIIYALYPSTGRDGGPFIKFTLGADGKTAGVAAGYTAGDYGNGYTYIGQETVNGVVYAHLKSNTGANSIPQGHFTLAEYSTNIHYELNTAEYVTPAIRADSYLVIKDADAVTDTPYLYTSFWKTEKTESGAETEPTLSMDGIQYTLKDSKGNDIAVFTLDQDGYCKEISGYSTTRYAVVSATYDGHTQKILRGTVKNLSSGCQYVETSTNRNYILDTTPISAAVFSDVNEHVTITGTQAAMQIALDDLGVKKNENITRGSDRIADRDFYITVEKKSGSDTVKPDMSGVVYAMYPSTTRANGPFVKFTMGADGKAVSAAAGFTGNDYGNGYIYVDSYADPDTGVAYVHLKSNVGAGTIPQGHFVITEYSANSHYEVNTAEYATPLIRADEYTVIRDTDPLIETPFLFTSFWKGEKDESGKETAATLSMEGIRYSLYDTKNNRIAIFELDADGYCREITGYNSTVYTVVATTVEGHTQKILRGSTKTLSARCTYVETETNGNYIMDSTPVYAKVFTDADTGVEITGPQAALQITLADGTGEKDNPNITKGFDRAKKDYYIAFRKVANKKPVSDVTFDIWVNGTKLGKQAYTGWYLDAVNGTYPNSAPSYGSIYRGAKPYYTDSDGNRQAVPDGMAIVYLGRFDSAPVVQIQENWTGDQKGTLIDGTEKKQITAKDYAPVSGSGSRYTYAASAVCSKVEDAIVYVTGAATQRKATWENESVYVCLRKTSADPACSEGNVNYSLEGAEFALYSDEAEAQAALESRNFDKALTTLTTDADGGTDSINVTRWMRRNISNELNTAGTWFYAVEKKAPKNFRLADEYAFVNVKSGNDMDNPAILSFEDEPLTDPISARVIKKSDNESLDEGLLDAEFTIRFYPEDISGNYTYAELQNKQEDESRRLVIRTGRSASGRIQAELPAGTDFPIGYITIEETKAPENYLLPGAGDKATVKVGEDSVETDAKMAFVLTTKEDGSGGYESGWPCLIDKDGNRSIAMATNITLENELIYRDKEIRGNMELDKAEAATGEPMEGVGFRLDRVDEDKNILESHYLYTNAAGHATTVTPAYVNVNHYDDHAYDQTEAAVWFRGRDDVDAKDGDMALPKGDYILTEIRTPANAGYQLPRPFAFSIVNDGDLITIHTFSDGKLYNAPNPPALKTVAAAVLGDDADDRVKMIPANKEQTISDSVTFANLRASTTYTLVGEIYELTKDGPVPFEMKGRRVTAKKTFTTREMTSIDKTEYCVSGTEEVLFTGLDFTGLQDRRFVIYETLYLGTVTEGEGILTRYPEQPAEDEDLFPIRHADPDDQAQQFHTPDGPTEAKDSSGTKTVTYTDTVTIVDTVNYVGLVPGRQYEMKGLLHIRPEDAPADKIYTREELDAMILRDAKGDPVENSKIFTPEVPNGSVDIEFTFDVNLITKTAATIVCFEDCEDTKTGISVFTHADIHDKAQTVYRPEIHTSARDEYGRSELAAESGKFFDEIYYDNLEPETEYKVVGVAMNRKTKEKLILAGGEVTAEAHFTTGKANKENGAVTGFLTLEFTITKDMQEDLPGVDMVIFETVYVQDKNTGEWKEAARHHEIDDEGQRLRVPTLGTDMTDKDTGVHVAFPDETVTLVDVVTYTNLIPGKVYEMEGTLHIQPKDGMPEEVLTDKDGSPVMTKVQFTASETGDGTVEMPFTFSTEPLYLAGRSVVAFESCMPQGDKIPVAVHADINDRGQTVDYPVAGTTASLIRKESTADTKTFAVTDRISYTNLNPEYEYVARGWLVDQKGNKVVISGLEMAAEKAFHPTEKDGFIDVNFPEFTVPNRTSFTYIIFEEVYVRAEQGDRSLAEYLVGEHKQLEDSNQTVCSSYLKTTLLDKATGTHAAYPDQMITLVDTVQYFGLIPGKEYRLAGTLMNKAAGREMLDKAGKPITAEVIFTASETGDGVVEMIFTFDAKILEQKGASIVAFERCYPNREDIPVCVHTDINDRDQEVDIPAVETAAGKTIGESGKITITDVISYTNLNTDHAYVIRGVLVDQGGEPVVIDGRTIAAEVSFTPDSPDGDVSVVFPEFAPVWNKDYDVAETRISTESDTMGVTYEYTRRSWSYKYVVFEEVYVLDEENGEHLVGVHKDLTNTAQTITDRRQEEDGRPIPPPDDDTPPPVEKTPPGDTTPQTGDHTPLIPVILLLTVAFIGTVIVIVMKRRMRRRR